MLARGRIDDTAGGLTERLRLLADHGDSAAAPIPVAIETSRGLLVAWLRATGRPVYAINPLAAARYRDRHSVTRKKSDHYDALVLANILRTDAAAHRPLPHRHRTRSSGGCPSQGPAGCGLGSHPGR